MGYTAAASGVISTPAPKNEPVYDYRPKSQERTKLESELVRLARETFDMPLRIGSQDVRTGKTQLAIMPHDHAHVLGHAHVAGIEEIFAAIAAAEEASHEWSKMPWTERAAIFLRAADILAGPMRYTLNAATMLGQSKTAHQAEIDSGAELIDFWRFNVEFMRRLYSEQPTSSSTVWNYTDYRPLEGFVYALTPFNFTAIAGNLPTAPALMGNTVVWKPAGTAKLAAHFIMKILRQAGLPDGVINLIYGDGAQITDRILADPSFAGIHFTGSTPVFNSIWRKAGENCHRYRTYPRLVGETGGKNFILAHPSADVEALATAVTRGAFEYQGQKCSAASRIFIPHSIWIRLKERLCDHIGSIKIGDVRDFQNFMGAVIDEKSWTKLDGAIQEVRSCGSADLVAGGWTDKSRGYFIWPTLVQANDLDCRVMNEELFGPIVGAYVYSDEQYEDIARLIDQKSAYGLTGAVFATDRKAMMLAADILRNAAGNFYINDKPTGAVVGQQPFGGARASGTNDKAGSMWNLARWMSPRSIKETSVPPTDYKYPYMES